MALTGTYDRNLDEKQRLAIPKRLRDEFGESELTSFYVAPGMDRSLAIYSPAGFEMLAHKVSRNSGQPAKLRTFSRLFYSQAEKVDLDSQGRIRIPERLVKLAGLERDVVLLGVHDHAEIWNVETWRQFMASHGPDFDQISDAAFEEPDRT